jgi:ribosomal protein S18 acetylase RimI-like enzyme
MLRSGRLGQTRAQTSGEENCMTFRFAIRPAEGGDLASIARREASCMGGCAAHEIAGALEAMRKQGFRLLVAEVENCDESPAVGHIGLWPWPRHLEIALLAVDPAWRKLGVARTLLGHITDRLARNRRRILARCRVAATNEAAASCLLRCGWRVQPADDQDTEQGTLRFEFHTADPGLAVLRSILSADGAVVRS